jgi:glycine/D-amino acid oxidase-like deaminating enzyme/nitrite reductase/ring-hydroxylating ferredoxin subunit
MSTPRPSVWEATAAPAPSFPSLPSDLEVEVAVVGGGITGVSLADRLADAGVSAVLLEARRIGSGVTPNSTGHLTQIVDARYAAVQKDFGPEAARLVAESAGVAIDHVEVTAARYAIDCGFRRVPGTLFAEDSARLGEIEDEVEAMREAGLPVERVAAVGVPLPVAGGLRLQAQAEFHPLAYIRALARTLPDRGVPVFEGVRVVEVEPGEPVRLITENGRSVTARRVVLATHTPIGFDTLQTAVAPYRSYVIGAALRDEATYPDGLYFDTRDPYHYYRTAEGAGGRVLVAGGRDHKTGSVDDSDPYASLEAHVRERFPVADVQYRWSAQVFEPVDGLPFVGPSLLRENVYVATGLSGDGLLWGTAAALLLGSLVRGEEHPWEEVFRSTRFKPVAGAAEFVKHNGSAAVHFVADRFREDHPKLATLAPGEGGLVEVDGHQTAAYRDESGRLHRLSPRCTHMGCTVRWNAVDRTWDCPCHGARYAPTGEPLSAPATLGLSDAPGED